MVTDEVLAEQAKLDEIDDWIAASIKVIEGGLRGRIKIAIWIDVEAESFDRLGFGKSHREWVLLVKTNSGDVAELLSMPRYVRAEAFSGGWIRRLIENLGPSIRAQVAAREAATKEAAEVLKLCGLEGIVP